MEPSAAVRCKKFDDRLIIWMLDQDERISSGVF